jgi:N-methylhydantoinase B/oxoprolinase/acetone carboxylase alpha subunit
MAIMGMIDAAYPDLTAGEVGKIFEDYADMLRKRIADSTAEVAAMERVDEVAGSGFDAGSETMGEALRHVAEGGDEDAHRILAAMNTDENMTFAVDLDAAVHLDPYWEKVEDDGQPAYRVLPEATHETPDALVAAYRRAIGILTGQTR